MTRARSLMALGISVGGVVLCIAADWIAASYYADEREQGGVSPDVAVDVVISAPFSAIAILLLVTRMTRTAAGVVAVALAGWTVLCFFAASSGGSSTAVLALLMPWLYGFPAIGIVWAADHAARAWRTHRRGLKQPVA